MKNVKNTKSKDLRFAILATDVVIFTVKDDELKVFIIEVNIPPHFSNTFGVPGGLILPNETADESVMRHIGNKVGIKVKHIEQLYTFSSIDRDPRGRVVSVAYFAMVPFQSIDQNLIKPGVTLRSINSLPNLAYDHNDIVKKAIERLKAKLGYTAIVKYFLQNEFTLSDLQKIYEIIFSKKYDKRNFRKKILSLNILKPVGEKRREGAHRPADLYKVVSGDNKIFEIM